MCIRDRSQAKQSLEGEVTNLEQMTERLRRGILAIREGQVVFRSGEVVYAGVLKGSLNDEENSRQMQLFLATANEVTLHRMGIEAEEPVQAIWMPNEVIEEALTRIKAAQGNIFVRVRTVANIIAGAPAVCTLELAADNRCLLYTSISTLVSWLPYKLVVNIGIGIGHLYHTIAKKQRIRAEETIKERLGYSDEEAKCTIKSLFVKLGITFMEIMYMPALNKDNIRGLVTFDRPDVLWEALNEGHGVVMLACHMDNWEWLGAALSLYGFPISAVEKPQPNSCLLYTSRCV